MEHVWEWPCATESWTNVAKKVGMFTHVQQIKLGCFRLKQTPEVSETAGCSCLSCCCDDYALFSLVGCLEVVTMLINRSLNIASSEFLVCSYWVVWVKPDEGILVGEKHAKNCKHTV